MTAENVSMTPRMAILEFTCPPGRLTVAFGPSIGTYQGRDIPAWIVSGDGQRLDYVGVAGTRWDLTALGPRQTVMAPGLIYELRVAANAA